MLQMMQHLQKECDRQMRRILEHFRDNRRLEDTASASRGVTGGESPLWRWRWGHSLVKRTGCKLIEFDLFGYSWIQLDIMGLNRIEQDLTRLKKI